MNFFTASKFCCAASALIKQITKANDDIWEAQKSVDALKELRRQFTGIDGHLTDGPVPYEVLDELESYFDDLIYYLNTFILKLDELAKQNGSSDWIQ